MANGFVPPLSNPQAGPIYPYATTDPSGASDDPSADLSPDALLIYCQSRLHSIDGQIQTIITSQKSSAADISALNKALAVLQKDSGGTTSKEDCSQMESSLYDAITSISSTDPNCPALPDLVKAYNNLVYTGTGPTATNPYYPPGATPTDPRGTQGDGIINQQEMTSFVDTVQGAVTDMNSNSEIQMISIQSLMSQRQTAVQLTTNLVQALGDQENKIADNIGH